MEKLKPQRKKKIAENKAEDFQDYESVNMSIENNIKRVRENIDVSLKKAGRTGGSVKLIAVSKTRPVEDICEAYGAGVRDFGENYVQEILEKYERMPEGSRIHMIGHLQTNKVKKVIDKVAMIHSVDSLRLAEEISKEAVKKGIFVDILLEVNVAQESTKYGFSPAELIPASSEISELENINVKGIMTSAPITEDPELNRKYFKKMSLLLSEMREYMRLKGAPEEKLPTELSMGMTGDYMIAAEEGATMARVGTAIFGARDYSYRG